MPRLRGASCLVRGAVRYVLRAVLEALSTRCYAPRGGGGGVLGAAA